jgi:hypothetical protein
MTCPVQKDRLLAQLHRPVLVGSEALDQVLGSVQTSAVLAMPRCLLKLCALFGPRHLLVVKIGHLGHLPMYLFVAARQV